MGFLLQDVRHAARSFAGVSLFISLIAFVAICIPALRASRVNPTVALRYE